MYFAAYIISFETKVQYCLFTTNKPSITCINTQGDDDDYLVKIVVNWPCYAVMLTISTANKFTSNQTSVVSSRWHGNIFRFFLCYLLAYFCTEIKEVAKMYKSHFERLNTYNTFYIQWLLRRRWDCINIMKKTRNLYLLISLHLFSNSTMNMHDPISKIILNRLTTLRKSNLFTKYEHAVHKSCWRNKVYFSAVSCLILPQ